MPMLLAWMFCPAAESGVSVSSARSKPAIPRRFGVLVISGCAASLCRMIVSRR
jgi:hypothetical protein